MKQIFQSLKNGETFFIDTPSPKIKANEVLIKTEYSLISSGTERMLVDFGKGNILEKAKQQPDKLKEVINKARTDGIFSTVDAVRNKLNEPLPLGYCNVGKIIEIGDSVKNFKIGDRVVSNGPHAEIVSVSEMLCAKIPSNVISQEACFTVLGSIGLQGIRLANPTLGEVFVVSGLGLIGLLTAQILLAQGCIVLGIDPDKKQCDIAKKLGIKTLTLNEKIDPISWCLNNNNGEEIDGVLITASTNSSEPLEIAAKLCRKRGRIILIGVTGMNLRRDLFYKKEISFQISCSYGPGRYDSNYEDNSQDYPIGFVRWTEQRNFQAILQIISSGKLQVKELITHKFNFQDAPKAYRILFEKNESMGILLKYNSDLEPFKQAISINKNSLINKNPQRAIVSFIGAGNYAKRFLIPCFYRADCDLNAISSNKGDKATLIGQKFKFQQITTDSQSIIQNNNCNTVVIATRHDSHGDFVEKALKNGKHIFVEKPLCMTKKELRKIKESYSSNNILMVGFNRRFAPLIIELKKILKNLNGPKSFIYTCNAGFIDSSHWTQDRKKGGGRLLGEACHFIDLIRFLVGSPINDISVIYQDDNLKNKDTFVITLSFVDGSIGTINYFSNGSKTFPKERMEVFTDGKIIQIENFLKLKSWGFSRNINIRRLKQDKGQKKCVSSFLNSIKTNSPSPIPVNEIFEIQEWILKLI